jgi:dipeptidyl aminopeptidase/acylaminoacyl peptidase
MRVAPASGVGSGETLLQARGHPLDWSPDGRYLLYQTASVSADSELWVLPMDSPSADRKPFLYLTGSRKAQNGRFSPDGRFVAYVSMETGRNEVYVQQFPAAGGKWPISKGGGSQPRWRKDGKELFFLDPERILMSVAVTTRPEFRVSEPQSLFQTYQSVKVIYATSFGYDVSPDGRRFLVNSGAPAPPAREISVLLNWQSAQR